MLFCCLVFVVWATTTKERTRRVPPCAVKTCAVRPVFARLVGELRAADPSDVQGPVKQNASPGDPSEALRQRWKPGPEQHPGPENQDGQHMLEQPRGYFPEEQPPKKQQNQLFYSVFPRWVWCCYRFGGVCLIFCSLEFGVP